MGVRVARPDDLVGVLALYQVFRSHDPFFDAAAAEPAWGAMMGSGAIIVVVADVDGVLAATCTLAVVPTLSWGGRPYAVIEHVATLPDFRRQGLGHAVLDFAIKRAWAADCYKVTLSTGSQTEGTLQFYERAGFTRNAKTFFEISRR